MGTDFRSLPWVLARQPWDTFNSLGFLGSGATAYGREVGLNEMDVGKQRSGRHSRQGVFLHRCCECQRSGRPRRNAAWHFLREPISKHFLGCCRALLMGTDFRSFPWVLARQPWNTFQPHAFNSQARVFGFGCDGLWSGDWVERDGCGQAAQW